LSYLYFDESIRSNGGFIVGALVVAEEDLTPEIHAKWTALGLDPKEDEYKSSATKAGNDLSQQQRTYVRSRLQRLKLGLTIGPLSSRGELGVHCANLVMQLLDTGKLEDDAHTLLVDDNIKIRPHDRKRLFDAGIDCHTNVDSRIEAGIQIADHAAHALGGMLLEELGLVTKQVCAGESSGYDPDELLNLGFELWAGLRYALIGNNEYIEGLSPPPEDPANPFFKVDGYGLYLAPDCPEDLAASARKRFGVNYLGCIH